MSEQKDQYEGLSKYVEEAIDTIHDVMADVNEKPSERLKAANIYLELSLKYAKLWEIEQKVLALELLAAQPEGPPEDSPADALRTALAEFREEEE
jgi:hypothetical protein